MGRGTVDDHGDTRVHEKPGGEHDGAGDHLALRARGMRARHHQRREFRGLQHHDGHAASAEPLADP
jgi:hypothetical protein